METTKKRLLCVFLVLCIILLSSLFLFALAKESEEFKPVTRSLYSNLPSDKRISGQDNDHIFHIMLEDICKLTGEKSKAEPEKEAEIMLGNSTGEYSIHSDFLESGYAAEDTEDLPWTESYENDGSDIFGQLPQGFIFSSGAGAWETHIDLNPDGTFTGQYHDTEMGDTGSGYPNGTVYICNFDGKFSIPKQIDEYTYSMRLEYLNTEGIPGNEYYENNVRYVCSEPYGFDNADEFFIYLPGVQTADLPDGFISWLYAFLHVQDIEVLPYYGIYNAGGEEGFVAYK